MSFEAEYLDLMPDTVTVEPFVSTSASGSATYGTAKSFRGRIEQFARLVTDKTGREVVSNTRLQLAPTTTDGSAYAPTVADRITLPAGYTPQAPPVISVSRVNDEEGLHHWELSL